MSRRVTFHAGVWPGLLIPLVLGGCPHSDVGSPCNHGAAFVPQSQTITFPALACDQLLCVYAEDTEPPQEGCESNEECGSAGGDDRFVCVEGHCELDQRHVMARSMCSQQCDADADCESGDPDSACSSGFACARIQGLGDHCCEKLCVCRDDLDVAAAAALERECSADAAMGCCDREPHPEACGS